MSGSNEIDIITISSGDAYNELTDLTIGDITLDVGATTTASSLTYSTGSITSPYVYTTGPIIGSNGINIDDIRITDWNWKDADPFVDGFPDWDDFQKMCGEYPGLQKTLEHLKAFYNMCKDDWETKKKGE